MDNVVAAEGSFQLRERLGFESTAAYKASPFSAFSRDFSARFSRDPNARSKADEIQVDSTWKIAVPQDLSPLGKRMAKDLAEFLQKSMGAALGEIVLPRKAVEAGPEKTIALLDKGGGEEKVAESFTLTVTSNRIIVAGRDAAGLRDGIIHLVDQMGLRQAPIVLIGAQTCTPRLAVRLGATPYLGSAREAAFLGYNAAFISGGLLWSLSTSDAIPELAGRRRSDLLAKSIKQGQEAGEYGLKCYMILSTVTRFSPDDPIFQKYPDIRGSSRGGTYCLCTEHPLTQKYLAESVAGLFRAVPELDGVVIIIGGEGFYHCFMGAQEKCPRCTKLGAETVVANLCNRLAAAVREVKPAAEVIAWPYSAFLWSADPDQAALIAKLKPGTAILTEVEKDEHIQKPDGVNKSMWDYSIDMVGLGGRATRQLAACRKAGIPIYFKSEPEMSFEAPRLPHVPCLDRWFGRASAIAGSGASGLFNFSGAGKPTYGASSAEVYKYACWNPSPKEEDILPQLAARIAGPEGGPHLRNAWKAASEAIDFSPEVPSPYYTGPYYLGPAHPMCANPNAPLPEVFYGRFLFLVEESEAEGLRLRPTFLTTPSGNVPVFGKMYREMANRLKLAKDEVKAAEPRVPDRCRLMFRAEASSILWFYATARTHANFYESCQLRDQFRNLAQGNPIDREKLEPIYDRWLEVLKDERQNANEALPLAEADMRLDCYYGLDHCFSHMADMVRAKLKIIDGEINEYLPSLRKAAGLP